ncbi:MAG TPA: DUF4259 domain-containing protein [Vitreimonas sp.]|uniref:DUF4259 domain-containing protein n=1 Tax=Vitreimonas sp. TaxID=3069702 RepID=UPI002D42F0F9|nr:DUF4259 domain-containing protein [Vitreimonas sp.]HYD89437.1 DUF4259 domain-containing protein [Vitreimonas sp.]
MGAWGSGPFDNDDAGDLLGSLVDAGNWTIAEQSFDAVLSVGEGYLEAPESSAAIAAAAIVAHKFGNLAVDIDPEDAPAIAALRAPSAELIEKARSALARIKKQSELADLWDDAGAKDEWLATLTPIENAL